ncbi:MAG: HDIG domain-containing protein [Firmicutes bacterium]|nr:HDIG domain-containing protein [Bacillota bacterium]
MEPPFLQQRPGIRPQTLVTAEFGQRLTLAVATFVLLTLLASLQWVPQQLQLTIGQPAPRKIIAPKTVKYEDEEKTEQLRANVAELVEPVYDPDISVLQGSLDRLQAMLEVAAEIRSRTSLSPEEKTEQLMAELNMVLPVDIVSIILNLSEDEFAQLNTKAPELVRQIMEKGVRETDLPLAKATLAEKVGAEKGSSAFKQVLSVLTEAVLQPNLVYNEEATERRRLEARDSIQPVEKTIWQNTVIVREGDPITSEHLQILKALGLLQQRTHWTAVLGVALVVAFLMVLTWAYLWFLSPKVIESYKLLLLLALIAVGTLALERIFLLIPTDVAAKFFPAAAASLLVAILLDGRLAILTAAELALLCAIMAGSELSFAVEAVAGSLAGILAVQKVSQRSDLIKAGLFVGGANVCIAWALGLIANAKPLEIVVDSAAGLLNGLLAAILAIGLLPFVETAFGITTPIRLLELANPNHPLLKRLLFEAPGTYHHSILVGNLAEAAADAVGADTLLVRVASYYHDVGKIKRPEFFIENQLLTCNPHDKMSPSLSALVITSHIKEGLELAREYKLPSAITEILRQHHGTTLVSYFYHQAAAGAEDTVSEDSFRYDGPIPQTKEAALVMLADAAEAAVRSLTEPTLGKIEGLIRKIIKDRLHDGQLDQSDLTLRDLDKTAEAFTKVLTGIYHHRVPYPDKEKID